ncbi:MAG: DoxX family protein [Gemmatimonadales bacterium]
MQTSVSSRYRDYGLTILRIGIGIIFFAHGYLKFFKMGIGGTAGFMGQLGVPAPTIVAWFAALAEMLGGIAFILGIFTLPFAIALMVDMCGAIYFAKRGGGLFAPKGFELELSLLLAALVIALSGPGALSLGELLGRRRH